MDTQRDATEYRKVIEDALAAMGREDVAVAEMGVPDDGELPVTFVRGAHSHTASVRLDDLHDPERARAAINRAIMGLSKEVSHEAMEKAGQF
jgi:hypothetical protein